MSSIANNFSSNLPMYKKTIDTTIDSTGYVVDKDCMINISLRSTPSSGNNWIAINGTNVINYNNTTQYFIQTSISRYVIGTTYYYTGSNHANSVTLLLNKGDVITAPITLSVKMFVYY